MDRVLASDTAKYRDFVGELWDHHIVGCTQAPMARCSIFFVFKKSQELRLIADPHGFNQRCPPHMPLGGPATWSRVEAPVGETVYVGAADVESYFFRLGLPESVGKFFSLPPVPDYLVASLCGSEFVRSGIVGRDWHPLFKVCPVGFSWSFFFAQRVHTEMIRRSGAVLTSNILVDGQPVPRLEGDTVLSLPYCDNVHCMGTSAAAVDHSLTLIIAEFERHKMSAHEISSASPVIQAPGVVFDGSIGRVEPTRERLQKVISACQFVATRPRLSERQVRQILGHVTFLMLLNLPLLSVFGASYMFVERNGASESFGSRSRRNSGAPPPSCLSRTPTSACRSRGICTRPTRAGPGMRYRGRGFRWTRSLICRTLLDSGIAGDSSAASEVGSHSGRGHSPSSTSLRTSAPFAPTRLRTRSRRSPSTRGFRTSRTAS